MSPPAVQQITLRWLALAATASALGVLQAAVFGQVPIFDGVQRRLPQVAFGLLSVVVLAAVVWKEWPGRCAGRCDLVDTCQRSHLGDRFGG